MKLTSNLKYLTPQQEFTMSSKERASEKPNANHV